MNRFLTIAAACGLCLSLTGCYEYGPYPGPGYAAAPAYPAYGYPAYGYPAYYPYGYYPSATFIFYNGHYYDRHYYGWGSHGPRPIRAGVAPRPLESLPRGAHVETHGGGPRPSEHYHGH